MSSSRLDKFSSHLSSNAVSNQTVSFGKVGSKNPNDVVIVSAKRTAICRARKGGFKDTTPDDLLVAVFKGVLEDAKVSPSLIDDVVVGNVQTVGAYSMPARAAMFRAGMGERSSVRSVNRQCSSGLQSVASIASDISAGFIDVGIGAGVESMTNGGSPSDPNNIPPMNLNEIFQHPMAAACLTPMGMTSENVAEKFNISRETQDQLAVRSHTLSLKAQSEGKFVNEIVPVKTVLTVNDEEKEVVIDKDEGPRPGTTMEKLAKLKPVFKKGGSTTAGNASQVSDGAAAVLMMKRSQANVLGIQIIGTFRGFKVTGCDPNIMGIGPAVAIPALLNDVDLGVNDVDVYEINEAFASQAAYCVKHLGISMDKVNPNGGAISLGHPLGCTGSRMVATLLNELQRQKKRVGVVSMCIGTGMGAAGIIEAEV